MKLAIVEVRTSDSAETVHARSLHLDVRAAVQVGAERVMVFLPASYHLGGYKALADSGAVWERSEPWGDDPMGMCDYLEEQGWDLSEYAESECYIGFLYFPKEGQTPEELRNCLRQGKKEGAWTS